MSATIVACTSCGKKNRIDPERAKQQAPVCGACKAPLVTSRGASRGSVTELDDGSFRSFLAASSVPVLVDFYATWCGPCRYVSPIVEEIAEARSGKLRVAKVDIDRAQALAAEFSVEAVPTLLLFRNGKVFSKQEGAGNREQLLGWIDGALASAAA
jgi:thioredoxin 2